MSTLRTWRWRARNLAYRVKYMARKFAGRLNEEEKYAESVTALWRSWGTRMQRVLSGYVEAFREHGYQTSDVYDRTDAQYAHTFVVEVGLPERVDISMTLVESMQMGDGTEGVNISLDIVAEGGAVIAGWCLDNYTSDVWTWDDKALEARMSYFEAMPLTIPVTEVERWARGRHLVAVAG